MKRLLRWLVREALESLPYFGIGVLVQARAGVKSGTWSAFGILMGIVACVVVVESRAKTRGRKEGFDKADQIWTEAHATVLGDAHACADEHCELGCES